MREDKDGVSTGLGAEFEAATDVSFGFLQQERDEKRADQREGGQTNDQPKSECD